MAPRNVVAENVSAFTALISTQPDVWLTDFLILDIPVICRQVYLEIGVDQHVDEAPQGPALSPVADARVQPIGPGDDAMQHLIDGSDNDARHPALGMRHFLAYAM